MAEIAARLLASRITKFSTLPRQVVRQALLDAADALTDQAAAVEVHEGIRPEDLNAANDD